MTEQTFAASAAPATSAAPAANPAPASVPHPRAWRSLVRRPRIALPAAVVLVVCAMAAVPAAFAGWFGHGDPRACDLADSGLPPRTGHPFGFDIQGCDLYANVVYGARASVTVGVLVTAGTMLIAVVLGSLAGYFRGWVDAVISRIMDVFFGFPYLVGMIVILQTMRVHNVLTIAAVITLFGWPALARVMRASVLSSSGQEYIAAVRGLGAGPWRLVVRHVIPNSIGPTAVLASLSIGGVIAAESALTFLGVGLQTPAISWGVQLNIAQQYYLTSPHVLIFPALVLSVTVLAFVLLGDALRDAIDPRLR